MQVEVRWADQLRGKEKQLRTQVLSLFHAFLHPVIFFFLLALLTHNVMVPSFQNTKGVFSVSIFKAERKSFHRPQGDERGRIFQNPSAKGR
jgi:hypothetical protein